MQLKYIFTNKLSFTGGALTSTPYHSFTPSTKILQYDAVNQKFVGFDEYLNELEKQFLVNTPTGTPDENIDHYIDQIFLFFKERSYNVDSRLFKQKYIKYMKSDKFNKNMKRQAFRKKFNKQNLIQRLIWFFFSHFQIKNKETILKDMFNKKKKNTTNMHFNIKLKNIKIKINY